MRYRYLFIVLVVLSCKDSRNTRQSKSKDVIKTNSQSKSVKVLLDSVDKTIALGSELTYSSLPKLFFIEISKAHYLSYQKTNPKKNFNTNGSLVESRDSSFIIYTSKSKLLLKRRYSNDSEVVSIDYKGFVPDLKTYVFTKSIVGGDFELGGSFLIDSVRNIRYDFIPKFDEEIGALIVSPDKKYFLYYENGSMSGIGEEQENNSFIGIINISGKKTQYKEYASYTSTKWNISSAVWVTNNSVAIKINQPKYISGKWVNTYSYMIAVLPTAK